MKSFLATKLVATLIGTLAISGVCQAHILFQDDDFDTVESSSILIGSNDGGANNTSIRFGNDSTASNNGNLVWDIGTKHFTFDNPVDITGGLTSSSGINSTTIGAVTPATGAFTTLTASTSLNIGTGTSVTKHISTTTANVTSANISAANCGDYASIAVTGANVGDTVIATPEAISGGIETVDLIWNALVSASDTVTIRACNPLTLLGVNTANTQTWRVDIWQH